VSVLDVSPVPTGATSGEALRNTIDLARAADRLGLHRFWLAEHHGMKGIASAAPEVLIGHVAEATEHLRVGAGGIMLPNHAPLKVAELFRVLEALHPDRIDLGLGRAPGTDALTARALRGSRGLSNGEDFPQQLGELLAFGGNASGVAFGDDHPYRQVTAAPADVPLPPVWLLSSSGYSAGVAADLGLGFSFAHHISSAGVDEAIRTYHQRFEPSAAFPEPSAILTVAAVVGETDEHAEELACSMDLAWVRITSGKGGSFPSPEEARAYRYSPAEQALIRQRRAHTLVGEPATVEARIRGLLEATGADELMVTTMVFDHGERIRSYERLAKVLEVEPLL
jgi:luciferase family oxidoreductase group 1